jgi:NAD kinase
MDRLSENKIVLVTRKTRLDELIARFNTADQARFYVEHLGADFSDYQHENEVYKRAVQDAGRELSRLGRLQVIDRAYLSNFIFGAEDVVVALGQDGLVANILKYLDRQLLIGINPEPERWEGVLLPFKVADLCELLPEVFANRCNTKNVSMAEASLNTGETLYGVNDLFVGPKSHTSARYSIQLGDKIESQSSSGIIISTGLGSTGWFRSIVAGATGVAASMTGRPLTINQRKPFTWDSNYLYFSVREPWPSKNSSADIVFGKITASKPLTLVSYMPENGVIFSDGVESDFLRFNAGTTAKITISSKKGHLVV